MDTIINILGFVAGLLIGVIAIFVGIRTPPHVWQIAFGVWALVSVILAWFSGASAAPGGNPFKQKLQATFKNVPDWAWWIIAIGLVVVVIVAVVVR
jgi:hypothetical protein